jgi:hypothetical protein
MGFARLPLRCPHCARRIPAASVLLHGGLVRCPNCHELQYVVLVQAIGMVFLIDVSAREAMDMACRGLSTLDVLRELGADRRVA